jgi:hypothetical protein
MGTVPVHLGLPLLVIRNSAMVSREIASETIVVPICAGVGDMEAVYTFNELGGQLWHLLEQSRAPEDLVTWVTRNFDVHPDMAAADVYGFLADLREIGLIQPASLIPGSRDESMPSPNLFPSQSR